jgi:hypothetical protein
MFPRSSLQFPGLLMSDLELPADMAVASCRVRRRHEGSYHYHPLQTKNSKLTCTNGFGSGEQPTAQSPEVRCVAIAVYHGRRAANIAMRDISLVSYGRTIEV